MQIDYRIEVSKNIKWILLSQQVNTLSYSAGKPVRLLIL